MSSDGDAAFKVGIPLHEESVDAIDLLGNRVDDGLAVSGAVVEQDV